jgi:hypothetical protein
MPTPGRQIPAPFCEPHVPRSLLNVATSIVPYLALSVLLDLTLGVSVPLTVALGFAGQSGDAADALLGIERGTCLTDAAKTPHNSSTGP